MPLKFAKNVYESIGCLYLRPLLYADKIRPPHKNLNERPLEYAFVFKWLWRIKPKTILDVGTGKSSLPHLMAYCGFNVTATDYPTPYWSLPYCNRHYLVLKDDITNTKIKNKFDCITCISTLEHIFEYGTAVSNMFDLLNDGGHLIITFPYGDISMECKYRHSFTQVLSDTTALSMFRSHKTCLKARETHNIDREFQLSMWVVKKAFF